MNNQEAICRKIGVIVGFVLNICVTLVLTLVKVVSKESKTIAKDFEAIDNGEAVKTTQVVEEAELKETAEEIKELVGGEADSNDEISRLKEEMARLQKSLELAEQKVGK
jgi:hypothetical protein|nr:MAG TPA: hypothetical protein [Caudoviricetes sp.]